MGEGLKDFVPKESEVAPARDPGLETGTKKRLQEGRAASGAQ